MEPLKSMKPQQVLTEESILKLKRVLMYLQAENNKTPAEITKEKIEDLKSIITDTE